ncbi:MAG TPA: hypothetical protein VLT58_03815, partial [Polyangia bacterium]|nr:hypothetical protein [Polyangia bacterium]
MTMKPPTGLAATGHPDSPDHDVEDLSDELVVDSSQDVTVEASDDSTLELEDHDAITATQTPAPTPAPLFASMETPPPLATNSTAGYARRGAPTLLGMPHPSMPLPGASAPASTLGLGLDEDDHDVGEDDDEVTVMARPSVTDDEEEATKVEPAETAIRAAALKDEDEEDELTAALSTQASVERERALRKSMPPSLDVPLSAHSYRAGESSGAEFADSADVADDDDVALADETLGVAMDEDESATGNYSPESDDASELEAVLAPRRPTSPAGSSPLGGAGFGASPFSASAPLARADGFGGRLPTPSAGLGLTLPPSPSLPPPAASPFSSRLAPGGSPYPRTMSPAQTGSIPALQIPAPSGAVTVGSIGGIFRNVQLPLGGLVASCLACLVGGLVIGGKFLGTRAPAPAPVVAAAPAPLPPAAAPAPTPPPPVIVAQPTPAPTHAAPS